MPVDVVLIALENRKPLARLPALLRRAGARVILLGNTRVAMGWSRFVDGKIPCAPEPLGIALAVRALIHQSDSLPWLMCCDDQSLAALSQNRGQDWLDRMYPVNDRGPMVDAIFRKSAFATAAAGAIAMPPSSLCTSAIEARYEAEKIAFPITLARDIDAPGKNSIIVQDAQDIAKAYGQLAAASFNSISPASEAAPHVHAGLRGAGDSQVQVQAPSNCQPLFIQKFIPGNPGSTDILYHRGRPVCWSSWFTTGHSAFDPQLDDLITAVGNLTAFQGFAGIEWTRDPAGKFHLTRFIGTPTPGLLLGHRNGVDFSRALWELFHGMLRVQKPRAIESRKLSPFARVPWTDPGLLVRSMLDLASGK